MENLIPVLNKLQEVFNTTGTETIQLPQIVVIGTQVNSTANNTTSALARNLLPVFAPFQI